MGIAAEKAVIRDMIRARRAERDPDWIERTSAAVAERIGAWSLFRAARRVFCSLSTAREVSTRPLLAACAADGKTVCVPAWDAAARCYRPARYDARMELRAGPLGIPQPARPEWMPVAEMDLALVPGLAFDRHGHRLGHGGGHYDRMLQPAASPVAQTNVWRVGVGFAFQVLPDVPAGPHDIAMNFVVTENEVIDINNQGLSECRARQALRAS